MHFDPKNPPPPGGVSYLLCSLTKNREGRAASGGALAPQPPRATRSKPESIRIRAKKKNRKNFRLRPLTGVRLNLKFQWKTEYIATNDMRKGMGSENENKFSKNCNKFFKNFWFQKINK